MTVPQFGRRQARALPVLLAGALLLALPAQSTRADNRGNPMPADFIRHLETAVAEVARAAHQHQAERAQELEQVLEELLQTMEQLESMKHHHHHHKDSAFDKGLQQFADYAPDQDQGYPTGFNTPSDQTGTSGGSTGQHGTPATSGQTTPATKGAPTTKGSFDKGWHHFGEWWHVKHHHPHHHDHHPFNPGHSGAFSVTAKKTGTGSGPAGNSKFSTTAKGTKSPANGQNGQHTAGNTTKTFSGNHSAGSTNKFDSAKNVAHHEVGKAGKGPAGQARAGHFAAVHNVGSHVGSHPAPAHHTTATGRK
jgi:hypothetical protein